MKKQQSPVGSFLSKHAYIIIVLVLVAIVIAIGIAYELGYRIAPGFTLERVGIMQVTNVPGGTNVFVDQMLSKTSVATGTVPIELVPGTHTVIVSAPNDYPWSTNVSSISGKTFSIDPILVKMRVSGKEITGTAKTQALAIIASTTLPTETAPLELQNGCALVYVDSNQIIESPATTTPNCTPPAYLCAAGKCNSTIIFAPVSQLKAVMPYPGRQDSLVVLIGTSLYALGLDPQTPQFFAPIAQGFSPSVGELPDGTVLMSDGGSVASLSF